MDIAGVDKLIQLTRGLMGFDNSYSIEGATRFPNRIRVMGRFNAGAPTPWPSFAAGLSNRMSSVSG
jgi:hypothetical protein